MSGGSPRLRVIGAGRAGRSIASALAATGWQVAGLLGRDDDPTRAAEAVELLVIATPDAAIEAVARAVQPVPETLVVHLAGSLGLRVLATHPRHAALHPLVSMPDPEIGAQRLRAGAWWAIAGDDAVRDLVAQLGGRAIAVAEDDRAAYHAAACVASNHLVALLGQVERIAGAAGVPLEAFLDLARESLASVSRLGPARALTGPIARGDEETVAAHLAAIHPSERAAYEALADAARRLVEARQRGG